MVMVWLIGGVSLRYVNWSNLLQLSLYTPCLPVAMIWQWHCTIESWQVWTYGYLAWLEIFYYIIHQLITSWRIYWLNHLCFITLCWKCCTLLRGILRYCCPFHTASSVLICMFVGSIHRGTECGKNPSFGTQQEMWTPPSGTNPNQPQRRDYQHSRFSEVP